MKQKVPYAVNLIPTVAISKWSVSQVFHDDADEVRWEKTLRCATAKEKRRQKKQWSYAVPRRVKKPDKNQHQLSSVFIFPAEKETSGVGCAASVRFAYFVAWERKSRCRRSGRPSLVMVACWESW
jgi:hypothetical protein